MMRKERWSLGVCIFTLMLFAFYQNCSNSGFQANSLYDGTANLSSTACNAVNPTCLPSEPAPAGLMNTPIASRLYLALHSSNPITVPSGSGALEVDGDCGSGGFPATSVVWSLISNGSTVASGNQSFCDSLGRMRLYVGIPSGYVYAGTNMLNLELVGVAADGTIVHHPQGFTKASIQITE